MCVRLHVSPFIYMRYIDGGIVVLCVCGEFGGLLNNIQRKIGRPLFLVLVGFGFVFGFAVSIC